jgi:dTDP-4-amino-4,6-dideoxygalactose transaminase
VVPVVDLSRLGGCLADTFAERAATIARSGHWLLGPWTERWERTLADSVGAAEAVAVASGASALQLALMALGIGSGDEVIVPAFTAVPTAAAVCAVGAIPVCADVDPLTACLTDATVTAVRTPRTRAVIVVHLYGLVADLPALDVPIIEDVAQAHGSLHGPRPSVAQCYSFYPTKNVGGIGDGGAVVTDDVDFATAIRQRRVHGMTGAYIHESVAQNFRMSEIEASWLDLVHEHAEAMMTRRRHIAQVYRSAAPHLRWQATDPTHSYHLCVFRHQRRDEVRNLLGSLGVSTAVHYPLSIPEQPAYAELCPQPAPVARQWAATCVTVPCFAGLSDDEVATVAAALAQVGE